MNTKNEAEIWYIESDSDGILKPILSVSRPEGDISILDLTNESEVERWHLALDSFGKLQPILSVSLLIADINTLKYPLSTERPGATPVDFDDKTGYLFAYDNNCSRPYPSVMIFRYRREGEINILENMGMKDFIVVPQAVEDFLE